MYGAWRATSYAAVCEWTAQVMTMLVVCARAAVGVNTIGIVRTRAATVAETRHVRIFSRMSEHSPVSGLRPGFSLAGLLSESKASTCDYFIRIGFYQLLALCELGEH
ncbi:hypothetical protein Areg01_82980 [Actinoplanes regularis]|nr:hypothetical protein Areg01_82980 [Actinoplanes regularis]